MYILDNIHFCQNQFHVSPVNVCVCISVHATDMCNTTSHFSLVQTLSAEASDLFLDQSDCVSGALAYNWNPVNAFGANMAATDTNAGG